MPPRHPKAVAAIGALAVIVGLLSACTPSNASPVAHLTSKPVVGKPALAATSGVSVLPDLVYASDGGQRELLDACLPPAGSGSTRPRPAIVVVHGGSWARGDKADPGYRAICQWLASAGYPTFDIDYRLSPQFPYPAGIDDVRHAVIWLRESAQVKRFHIDPDRIGAFGGSAGANLASLLGTEGRGAWTSGSRVAAVVELSGPVDLTGADATADFIPQQLSYLHCRSEADCPDARAASPIFDVDPSDPPFFVAHSTDEKIPLAQSTRFVARLRASGVPATFVTVPGQRHSITMLNDALRSQIVAFYRDTLGVGTAEQ